MPNPILKAPRGSHLSHGHGAPYSIAATLCLLAAAASVQAEGFRNPPPGSFGLGRAGGRIAHVDDATAATHNPANLVELNSVQASVEPTAVYIKAKYKSPTGETSETESPWKLLPHAFAAVPLSSQYALGIAVTTPYGLSNEWDPKGSFRYTAPHFAELKYINVNPSFAARLGEHVNVGVGLNLAWSQLQLRQFYPFFMAVPGAPAGEAKFEAEGLGVGGNAGVTWKINPRHRLALTYRSPININYDGDFNITNVPDPLTAAGITSHSDFSTRINYPTIVAVGYGVEVTDTIRLEADVEWLEFSRFQSLPLRLNRADSSLLPGAEVRHNWKDTFTLGLGGDWRFQPGWVLRAGYQFYESPVPSRTYSPTIPDANQHAFTMGIGYTSGNHRVEGAYGAVLYDDREIRNNQNPAYNGSYEVAVHILSATYRYSF